LSDYLTYYWMMSENYFDLMMNYDYWNGCLMNDYLMNDYLIDSMNYYGRSFC